MEALLANPLPKEHVQSLREIEDGYWWYQGRIHWAKELVRPWKKEHGSPKVYADLGCGTGGFAKELQYRIQADKVLMVDGDLSPIQCSGPNFQKLGCDFSEDFKLPEQASVVTCMDVLEHIEHEQHFLENIYENMTPGGLLILSVPALPWLFSEWDRKLGHYRRYTRSSLTSTLQGAGFFVHKMQYMWSFLMPAAPYRKFAKYKKSTEFEKVSPFFNFWLQRFSEYEFKLSQTMNIPFGTSLMAACHKL